MGSRDALWHPELDPPVIIGFNPSKCEVLVTYLLDAEPDHRYPTPGPSIWPFIGSLVTAVAFTVSMFSPWGLPLGMLLGIPAMVGWFWPKGRPEPLHDEQPGLRAVA